MTNERKKSELELRLEAECWRFLGNEPKVDEYETITVPVKGPNGLTYFDQELRRRLTPITNTVERLTAKYSMGEAREVRVEREAFDSNGNPLKDYMAVYVRDKLLPKEENAGTTRQEIEAYIKETFGRLTREEEVKRLKAMYGIK